MELLLNNKKNNSFTDLTVFICIQETHANVQDWNRVPHKYFAHAH